MSDVPGISAGGEPVALPPAVIEPVRKPRRRRNHVEQFRTDDAEHAALEARAREAGLSIGAYARACSLGDAGPRAKRRPPVNGELVARANAEMNRAGNNLNQIAHALNAGGSVVLAEIVATGRELLDVLALYRQAAGYDRQG